MNIFKAYIKGFLNSVRLYRMIFILYTINFVVAILLAISFFNSLHLSVGHSLERETILKQFDFSFFVDISNQSLDVFINIFCQIQWFVLIYWLLSVFVTGGVFQTIVDAKFNITTFLIASLRNFIKFFGINILSLVFHILIIAIIYPAFYYISVALSSYFTSENSYYIMAATAMFIHLFFFLIILMINDYAKFFVFTNRSNNIFKGVIYAIRFIFYNFLKTYSLLLFLILPSGILIGSYFLLAGDLYMTTILNIILMFLIQQIFIFLKIGFKVWRFSSHKLMNNFLY